MPPCWRTKSQLNSAARALPTWKYPVGDGAKRARGGVVGSVMRHTPSAGGMREEEPASVFLYGDGARRAAVDRLAQALAELLGAIRN